MLSICLGGFYLAFTSSPVNLDDVTEDVNEDVFPTQITEDPVITISPRNNGELSIYNDNLTFKEGEQVYVSEMYLLEEVVDILNSKNWNYQEGALFPITTTDSTKITMNDFELDEEDRTNTLTIPSEKEYLYLTDKAVTEIEQLIVDSRAEFLEFLKSKGVAQKYIDEINNNTFPASKSRYTYHPVNDPDSPPSATEGLIGPDGNKDDYSQLQMDIYPVDIYNNSLIFTDSGILGNATDSVAMQYQLRDMGLRYLVYHEMGHVLQKAFDTVNTDSKNKTTKSSWIYAERSLHNITDKYAVKWSDLDSINDINNRVVNNESQADGVAYQAITEIYNMSEIQRKLAWEHLYGRLETSRDQWDKAMQYFEDKQPNLSIEDVPSTIFDSLKKYYTPGSKEIALLLKLTSRLDNLPAYGGYFHPMLPQDSQEFWDYLEY
jgi:hypothetical protein